MLVIMSKRLMNDFIQILATKLLRLLAISKPANIFFLPTRGIKADMTQIKTFLSEQENFCEKNSKFEQSW